MNHFLRIFIFVLSGMITLSSFAKKKPAIPSVLKKNKNLSTETIRNNTLIFNKMQEADWKSATLMLQSSPPLDYNVNTPFYSTEIVSRKANKVPMPTINNTNVVTKIVTVLAAPLQAIASIASKLGPDYIESEQQKKDTFSLPYYFYYHAHLTKDPLEAMFFYNHIRNNGWDAATFIQGLEKNEISRNLPFLKENPSDSLQKFIRDNYHKPPVTDEVVIKNMMLFSVLGQDTCTIERLLYEKWSTPEQDISPFYSEYKFLSNKITGVYAEYILMYPLQIAVYKNDLPSARALLRNGANPNVLTNKKGKKIFFGISPNQESKNLSNEQTCLSLTRNPEMQALLKAYGGKTRFWLKAGYFWKNLKKSIGINP